jgi:hypothetical protein
MTLRSQFLPAGVLVSVLLLAGAPAGAWAAGADQLPGQPGAAPQPVAGLPALTPSQQEAAALFKAMSGYLAGLQSFSVAYRSGYDVVQSTGQKIEFGETRRLMLVRPDRLRMEEVSSDGTRDLVIFDGRNITVLNADEKVFAQAPQPASLDDALGYFVRDLKMRMPLALMLTTRFPEVLANRISAIDYVERTEILGAPAHHIAGRGENVDFQFWIRDGERPLPLRLILTYRDSPGQPQHWAIFADWDTSPSVADSDFEFAPPADARQIPFAVQFRRPEASPTPPAANGGVQP